MELTYRTTKFLAILLFFNILSASVLLKEYLTKQMFKITLIFAMLIFVSIIYFINDRKAKLIIQESESLKVNKFWEYVVDFYPHSSFLFFLVAVKASISTFFICFGLYLLYKLLEFFAKM